VHDGLCFLPAVQTESFVVDFSISLRSAFLQAFKISAKERSPLNLSLETVLPGLQEGSLVAVTTGIIVCLGRFVQSVREYVRDAVSDELGWMQAQRNV
jgi:hypothetical protein